MSIVPLSSSCKQGALRIAYPQSAFQNLRRFTNRSTMKESSRTRMKEFDYTLNYKTLDFADPVTARLYRIGRGEQGVLLVRPYTNDLVKLWRFKTPTEASISARAIYAKFVGYLNEGNFVGADMARKFLEMGFTRSRRYANHRNGRKYNLDRTIRPHEPDHATCKFAESAKIFKEYRDRATRDPNYITMRKEWRKAE